jgi:hypothetical protein
MFDVLRPQNLLTPPWERTDGRSLANSLLMVTAILLVGSLVAGCGGDTAATDRGTSGRAGPANGEDATQVEAYHVHPRSFEDFVEVTGTVEAIHDATLSAQVSGTVVRLEERGTRIASGGLIAQVDSVDARAAMVQAKAPLSTAGAAVSGLDHQRAGISGGKIGAHASKVGPHSSEETTQ